MKIAAVGAGRMGRGIAVAFAYAGHSVTLIDVKGRSQAQFDRLKQDALAEIQSTLASLARFGLMQPDDVAQTAADTISHYRASNSSRSDEARTKCAGAPEVHHWSSLTCANARLGPRFHFRSVRANTPLRSFFRKCTLQRG
jgi:3-hydroxybutyryl-CoA dehydrogenase